MSATAVPKVSFTIRRPTPVSRADSSESDSSSFKVPSLPRHLATTPRDSLPGSPLANSTPPSPKARDYGDDRDVDSSDEDEDGRAQDELVTGFDQFGVQRLHAKKKKPTGPLVIPALRNKDWRELARKRRGANQYVPESAKATTGKDGSAGGLGTRDTINSGPVLSGLQFRTEAKREQHNLDQMVETSDMKVEDVETEDQKAIRAILASASSDSATDGPVVDIIPVPTPVSETDAFLQDVQELPDVATLADYERVPVSQFGAALLRGMGWKEGTAASRKKGLDGKERGLVEPYLPESRPALLGIGAKERIIDDDGSNKRKGNKRPERRYVPVVRKEKEEASSKSQNREGSGDGDGDRKRERTRYDSSSRECSSRRRSRSPARRRSRERDHEDRRTDGGSRRDHRSYDRDRRDDDRTRYSKDTERDRDRRRAHSSERVSRR